VVEGAVERVDVSFVVALVPSVSLPAT
jgi:hypothetical protein